MARRTRFSPADAVRCSQPELDVSGAGDDDAERSFLRLRFRGGQGGDEVGGHRVVPGHLSFEDVTQEFRVEGRVDAQEQVEQPFIGGIVRVDPLREPGPFFRGEPGDPFPANLPDDLPRCIKPHDAGAALDGGADDGDIVPVIAPLVFPIDPFRERFDVDLSSHEPVQFRLVAAFDLFQAENERPSPFQQLGDDLLLESMMAV